MDDKTKTIAEELLKDRKIKPFQKLGVVRVIDALMIPTGVIVILEDGRKLTLTKLSLKEKAANRKAAKAKADAEKAKAKKKEK